MAQDMVVELKRGEGGTGGNRKLMDSGLYRFQIKACEVKTGAAGPYAALQLYHPQTKGSLFTNVSNSEKARWKMDEFLDALALPDRGKFKMSSSVGKWVWAEIDQRSYESQKTGDDGKVFTVTKLGNNVVRFVLPKEAEQLAALNPQDWDIQAPEEESQDEDDTWGDSNEEDEQVPAILDGKDIPF